MYRYTFNILQRQMIPDGGHMGSISISSIYPSLPRPAFSSPTLVPAPRAWEDPSSVPGRAHADAGRAGDGRYGCGKAEVTFFGHHSLVCI